jgi:hypothetical protein
MNTPEHGGSGGIKGDTEAPRIERCRYRPQTLVGYRYAGRE